MAVTATRAPRPPSPPRPRRRRHRRRPPRCRDDRPVPVRPANAIFPFAGGAPVPGPGRGRSRRSRATTSACPIPSCTSTSLSARVRGDPRPRRPPDRHVGHGGGERVALVRHRRPHQEHRPRHAPSPATASPHRCGVTGTEHRLRGPGELGGPRGRRRASARSSARASSWAAPTGQFGPFDGPAGLLRAHRHRRARSCCFTHSAEDGAVQEATVIRVTFG